MLFESSDLALRIPSVLRHCCSGSQQILYQQCSNGHSLLGV